MTGCATLWGQCVTVTVVWCDGGVDDGVVWWWYSGVWCGGTSVMVWCGAGSGHLRVNGLLMKEISISAFVSYLKCTILSTLSVLLLCQHVKCMK